jgi:lipoprotein LpqH
VENRFVAVAGAALAVVAGVAGCSSSPPAEPPQPGTLPPNTAQLTINGRDMGRTHALSCSQVQRLWTIDAGDHTSGATTILESGDNVAAKFVEIRNVGGFSGTYWEGNGGNADASIVGNTWTVSGTVDGFNTDNPTKPASGTFKIKANC